MYMLKEVSSLSKQYDLSRLIRLRDTLNHKRPKFRRYESWRYKRVSPAWRRPRGIDSAMREKRKGLPKMPNIGYRNPKLVRYYHPSGKLEIIVHNVKELEGIDPEQYVVRIAHTVGAKKRLSIIERADELGLKIVNRRRIPEEGLGEVPEAPLGEEVITEEELEGIEEESPE